MPASRRQVSKHPTDRLRDLDFSLLVTLDALLKYASVTRAAEELEISQSAVSHALAKLRTLFGDPLFIKSHNRMVPTPKALALAGTVAHIVAVARDALIAEQTFSAATAQRTITLCLDDMGELAILPQLMAQLRIAAPQCTLRTLPATVPNFEELIATGKADLAITGPQPRCDDLMQQKLYSHRFTVIASRKSPLDGTLTVEQYTTLEHIAYAPALPNPGWVSRELEQVLGKRRVRLSTPHHLIVPLLVEQDPTLIAVVPALLASTYEKFADIKTLTPGFDLPKIEVYQFWHRRFDADPFSVWLRTYIRELFYRNPALHIE